jgi:predicted deacylase
MVASSKRSWHSVRVKTISSKRTNGSAAADAEVRQLRVTGRRIAADRKSILRFLAATGMYTATGKLKPRFR